MAMMHANSVIYNKVYVNNIPSCRDGSFLHIIADLIYVESRVEIKDAQDFTSYFH